MNTMNTPPITSDDLNALIDGTLEPERRAEVARGLATDAALRAEYAELRALANLLSDMPAYTPRRSFQLGAEYRRPTPITAAPSRVLRVLPIVRQLSVAAALIFMVVAGALYFDINGNLGGSDTSELTNAPAVTDAGDGASQEQEDAASDEILTDRGESASTGDAPMDDLTNLDSSDDDEDLVAQAGIPAGTGTGANGSDDGGRDAWMWTSIGLGIVAIALGGLWFMLAQVGRQSHARKS